MTKKETLSLKLSTLLNSISFSRRYYEYYEQTRQRQGMPALHQNEIKDVMTSLTFPFKYDAHEKFYGYREKRERIEIGLNVGFSFVAMELILVLNTKHGHIGGPFPLLAAQAEKTSNPNFIYSPAFPKIRFSSLEELYAAVEFGISLFEDIKRVILSSSDWNAEAEMI